MTKLKIDKNHKKIDARKVGNPIKRITSGLLAGGMALSMYSGSIPKVSAEELDKGTSNVRESDDFQMDFFDEIKIPEGVRIGGTKLYTPFSAYTCGLATGTLQVAIDTEEEVSLDFLKYFTEIDSLDFYFTANNKDCLKTVPNMPNVTNFQYSYYMQAPFTIEHAEVLKKFPNLKNFSLLNTSNVTPDAIEKLDQLESLTLMCNQSCDIDFTKLAFLKTLKIADQPYDAAIYLNSKEYNYLIDRGVNVEFNSSEEREQYLDISKKIDSMISEIGITENSTDKEKLDAVLIYVLENLEYDPIVGDSLSDRKDVEKRKEEIAGKGGLTAFFEDEDDYGICETYASITEALLDRVSSPEQNIYINNDTHSWCLMSVDGKYYYVDPTWLDDEYISKEEEKKTDYGYSISYSLVPAVDAIKEGNTDSFEWYMNPDFDYDLQSHGVSYFPEYAKDKAVSSESSQEIEDTASVSNKIVVDTESKTDSVPEEKPIANLSRDDEVKVNINGKVVVTTAAALVGVLSALGIAIGVTKKKKREKDRKRRRMQELEDDPFSTDLYGNVYVDSFSGGYDDSFGSSYDSSFGSSTSYDDFDFDDDFSPKTK